MLIVSHADGGQLLCVHDARMAGEVLAELQRLHATLTLRLRIAGIHSLIFSADVGQLRNPSNFRLHPIFRYLTQVIRRGRVVLMFILIRRGPVAARSMFSKLGYGSFADCGGHSHFLRGWARVVLELLL